MVCCSKVAGFFPIVAPFDVSEEIEEVEEISPLGLRAWRSISEFGQLGQKRRVFLVEGERGSEGKKAFALLCSGQTQLPRISLACRGSHNYNSYCLCEYYL